MARASNDAMARVQLNSLVSCGIIFWRMEKYMMEALQEAEKAKATGDVPIGCVIVKDDAIIARGCNRVEAAKDPTAHAEMEAIRPAVKATGRERLTGCTMYVTLEPCSMCAGAIVLSRIERLVIGTMDPKTGACGSLYNIVEDQRLNHRVEVITGVLADLAACMIKDFFADLRKGNGGKQ